MNPYFFGQSHRPLFGVHHAAGGPALSCAAVLCNAFGQEQLRAHRSMRELAERLAHSGLDVLRFDYRGTGDSGGASEEGRVEEWLADVGLAVDEVRETSGRDRVCLVGLRLGASLAALAASRRKDVCALVLWDPVRQGAEYVDELRGRHAAWMQDHVQDGRGRRDDEALGFPLPPELVAGLRTLDLDTLAAPPARRTLLLSSAPEITAPPAWAAEGREGVDVRRFPPSPVWLHEEGLGQSLVPRTLLDSVTAWVRDACR